MDSGRLQPALLGGLFIGVLSALPIISAGNCCCCLWVLGGGMLAVYLRQQNVPVALEASEGALLGLMAGVIGGIVWGVLSIPIAMFMGPIQAEWMSRILERSQDVPPEMREGIERMMGSGVAAFAILFNVVISAVFGMLGGLLGVAIFKKNVPPPPPPPPTVIPHDPGFAQ